MNQIKRVIAVTILFFLVYRVDGDFTGDDNSSKKAITQVVWILPENLTEVSGICRVGDNRMACIQDEKGIIFVFNLSTSEIVKQISFGPDGDYEDIAYSTGTYYVLRSDGVIFRISEPESKSPKVTLHDLPLPAKTDVEGLCLDPSGKRLLLVIKSPVPEMEKPVYEVSLPGLHLAKNPAYRIRLENFIKKEASLNPKKVKEKGLQEFSRDLAKNFFFASLATHPLTGEIYLTDGERSKLYVVNRQGEVTANYQLDPDYLPKPEGISFSASGELLISSEGENKKPGVIARVKIN